MAEESTYSYQYPAEGIMNLLYGTKGAAGFFPMLQSYYLDQFNRLGQEDSSPYTYTGERIADFTPREEKAMEMADEAVGSYKPYLDRQRALAEQGIYTTQEGVQEAADLYRGIGSATYDPRTAYQDYEDPYTEAVTDKILEDIGRSGALRGQQLSASQVSQGAFGGSRGRLSQEDLQRQLTDEAVGALAGVRSAGYQQAQDRATSEFQRQQQAKAAQAQGISGLAGQLAGQLGAGERSYSELAQAFPGMAQQDINLMMGIGGLERGMRQSGLDLAYQNFTGQYNLPGQLFGQYGNFLGSLGPLAGGVGYSGVGNPPSYGGYGSAGYNPYMMPYNPSNPAEGTPGNPPPPGGPGFPPDYNPAPGYGTQGPGMKDGGRVAKLNMGGQVPNGKQMPSRVTDLLKMLRES